jgi:hypothetical protein
MKQIIEGLFEQRLRLMELGHSSCKVPDPFHQTHTVKWKCIMPCPQNSCLWDSDWFRCKHSFDGRIVAALKQLMVSTVKCHYHKMMQHLSQQLLPTFPFSLIPSSVNSRWWISDCLLRKVDEILWQETYLLVPWLM